MRGGRRRLLAAAAACAAVLGAQTVALAEAPNDPGFNQQWALTGSPASIHAPQAWCANLGGVLVADVDTGADFHHPDLAGKLVAGARFTSGRGDPSRPDAVGQQAVQDDHGHGTMTTGIMVADTNNGQGIAGVAPDAKALIVKVLVPSNDGTGSASGNGNDVAAGIQYAADYPGVKVINLSIGSDVPTLLGISVFSSPIPAAIDYASQRGVLVVAAAGNNYGNQTEYTSVENEALVAGALARNGAAASYSSSGSNIDAPGGDAPATSGATPDVSILSTWWDPSTRSSAYAAGDGTSFAAPQVAGTAAMLMARGLTAAQARQTILSTANGKHLNAAAALGRADNGPVCPPGATGAPPTNGGGLNVKPATPPKAAQSSRPRTPAAAPQVAAAPSPSPSASPSPSPSASPSPIQEPDTLPSPRVLAHAPTGGGGSVPAPLIALVAIVGIGGGYAGLKLFTILR